MSGLLIRTPLFSVFSQTFSTTQKAFFSCFFFLFQSPTNGRVWECGCKFTCSPAFAHRTTTAAGASGLASPRLASLAALFLNKDVIRISKRVGGSHQKRERGSNTPELKNAWLGIMLKFPFLAPNRSYGSLLSNIHGHLCYKAGYYSFNAARVSFCDQ